MALLMPSERCYGAAVYCKSKNLKSETLVRLITSKSRVAPIKSLTIPRLELCAAVLLAKLVKRVVAVLQPETAELYLWSDSMIILAWLRKKPMDLKTFVQNRVAKIQELYPNQLWRHVPSDQNPADLVSEESIPEKLCNKTYGLMDQHFFQHITRRVCAALSFSRHGIHYRRKTDFFSRRRYNRCLTPGFEIPNPPRFRAEAHLPPTAAGRHSGK
ncbi:uncharacterized protein TNCV_472351 [Trichonephila clavipes]|nr:uncharacterized protein TNCV_472351 [Trichonephila clavipes]